MCVLGLGRGRASFLHIPHPALSPAASLPGSHHLTPPAWGAAPPPPPHQPSDSSKLWSLLSLNKTSKHAKLSLPSGVEDAV